MAEKDTPTGSSSLKDFLAARKAARDSAAPEPTPTPAPEPEVRAQQSRPRRTPSKKGPGVLRRVAGAVASEAFKGSGYLGSAVSNKIGGVATKSATLGTAKTSSYDARGSATKLSKKAPSPTVSPIGNATDPKGIEKQVVQLDREVRDYARYFDNEIKSVRSDIAQVSSVATSAQRAVEQIKRDMASDLFRKRIADARVRSADGKFMSADQVLADPSKVRPSDKNIVQEIIDALTTAGAIGGAGAAGAGAKGLLDRLKGRGGRAAGGRLGAAAKLGKFAVGSAGLLGAGVLDEYVFPEGEKSFNEYLKKYAPSIASKDEDVGSINRWIYNHGAGATAKWLHKHTGGWLGRDDKGDDRGDASKVEQGRQSADDDTVETDRDWKLTSKQSVSITATRDIVFEARNDMSLKARNLLIDVEKLTIKVNGKEMSLSEATETNGAPDSESVRKKNSSPGTFGSTWLGSLFSSNPSRLPDSVSQLPGPGEKPGTFGSSIMKYFRGSSDSGDGSKAKTSSKADTTGNSDKAILDSVQNGKPLAGAAVDRAMDMLNLNEHQDNATLRKYLASGGHGMDPSQTAWCAAFVGSSLRQSGMKDLDSNVARDYGSWGREVDLEKEGIRKGDVIVRRGSGVGGHVGMATGETRAGPNGETLYGMVSGNAGRGVDSVATSWESSSRYHARRATLSEYSDAAIKAGAIPDELKAEAAKRNVGGTGSSTVPSGTSMKDAWQGAPVNQSRVDSINRGAYADTIDREARAAGMDPNVMKAVAHIESGGNASASTGSYKGLYQMSDSEMSRFGGGASPFDPTSNIRAAMASMKNKASIFENRQGRPPTPTEMYLGHQQGEGGLKEHLSNPNRPAWQAMFATGEGRQKGEAWAKKAIWGNVPSDMRSMFPGGVESMTSAEFAAVWAHKLQGVPYAQALAAARQGVYGSYGTNGAVSAAKSDATPTTNAAPSSNPFDESKWAEKDAAWFAAGNNAQPASQAPVNEALDQKNWGDFKAQADKMAELKPAVPDVGAQTLEGAQATPVQADSSMAKALGGDDLDKQASDADMIRNIPTPPNLDRNDDPDAGQKLTDSIANDGRQEPSNDVQASNVGGGKSHSISTPVNHPESEAPRPGSDGYGNQKYDPDSCGICAV